MTYKYFSIALISILFSWFSHKQNQSGNLPEKKGKLDIIILKIKRLIKLITIWI